ncbi:hypothetical protein A2276_05360 [candidate division WOR-1 bacterium RIFOXYA12_FULL_43_27]|uniref:Polymerase nucleotidyl transferase domain-containing protein n=1 Tax=candidate division WOR-1 bacterium RIFOXYC2_FULL_46_14 TaxID=1802587 RepID=A0A1F4U406_UNCSA|nr:MAG: hypothetical protein A2276_05360 [candidate division WOR-1 bacterium RIFOXYA12_FULL_43_27]OGC20094.1 MAG: hypothetical protein A2292_03365 [candidate division WOR-1 bacterium RIFOXYB2_FULL_46_45]OGC32170.1 MAG: hypothetical protein A2232_08085 [candidate division WOR-1 bacterium RIFOXYA2_FULL_46_56]OGC39570.1 MAG: hypothetical protein A2438_08450 [candidate division WOR-1 bacterium RIFOXYC2_FULL_46_14]
MPKNVKDLLIDLKKGLKNIYRDRLRTLFLYGSYARGDANAGSDLDVAVIINDFSDIGKEIETTGQLVSELSLKNNLVVSLHPVREEKWENPGSPFLLNIKKEGVAI